MNSHTEDEHSGTPATGTVLSKDIVSAWFITVFNPMIGALAIQKELLEKRNYTWRYRSSEFESLGRPSDRIESEYLPNLEHVFDTFPQILDRTSEHGNHIGILAKRCADLQHVLEHSTELLYLYNDATSEEMLQEYGRTLDEIFGAYPAQNHLAYLAQLIINRTGILPDYYTAHLLWNRFHDRFIELLQKPSMREYEQKVSEEGVKLLSVTTDFLEMLRQIRKRLAQEYGVPFVTPGVRVA